MSVHFDVERLQNEIRHLINLYPELEVDGVLKADMIEGSTTFNEVMDHCLRNMREALAMSAALVDEMARMSERQTRFEFRALKLRELMFKLMDMAGQKKVERPRGTVSIANGRPKVVITDEIAVMADEKYVRTKREIDKRSLELDLKSGKIVNGATLSNAEPHLTIR